MKSSDQHTFVIREIGEMDGPEDDYYGIKLEGSIEAIRGIGALFGERVAILPAGVPAASLPADVAEIVAALESRARTMNTGAPAMENTLGYYGAGDAAFDRRAAAALTAMSGRLAEVERERDNMRAALTARAKTMLRLRDALVEVHDNIEDEGDRVYFGSTNDADQLKKVWHELDGWNWDDIMSDGELDDVYASSREAHARAEAAEARLAEAMKALDAAHRTMRNARGAIESDQIEDKDVRRQLTNGMEAIAAARALVKGE